MFKFVKLTLALTAVSVLAFAAPALAALGQIEGGDIYWAKNITQGGSYVDPASANPGDTLSFRVRIHNPGEACLTNVNVKAALPSGPNTVQTSTVTVWADNATTNYVSDTATVNLSSAQSISYVPGTTQLLNNSGVISNLPDTILTSGVNIGSVCISINERRFVQFQARVGVPTPPPTPAPTPTPTVTPTAAAKPAPATLPATGPGDVAGLFVGTSALAGVGHYIFRRFRG